MKDNGKRHRKSESNRICKFERNGTAKSSASSDRRSYRLQKNISCKDNIRPSVDSVALFKMVLIQHIYCILSLRLTLDKVNTNFAYR